MIRARWYVNLEQAAERNPEPVELKAGVSTIIDAETVGLGVGHRDSMDQLFTMEPEAAAHLAGELIAAARDAGLGMDAKRIARDAYRGES